MQVEDTKAVDMTPWEVLPAQARPKCPTSSAQYIPNSRMKIRKSEEIANVTHRQYDADSESAGIYVYTKNPLSSSLNTNRKS